MKVNVKFLVFGMLATACSNEHSYVVLNNSSAIKVKTETVRIVKGSSEFRYSGTVEPSQTIPLTFQSNGIVSTVLIQAGDMVAKGQLLATVDKADNENMYKAALAKYIQAKDAYNRLKDVHNSGSLPEIKWVEMETNLTQAESQMQMTKSNLEKCNMRAPDNGMIGKRSIEPGQSALSAKAPIELVKIEYIAVKISVPENEISKIRKGLKASFTISALDGKLFEGEVTNVGIVADQISRTYEVKITVKNSGLEIKPGMVCDVLLNTDNPGTKVVIPNTAVERNSSGETFVYVVTDDQKRVKKQIITVGNYSEAGIVVQNGLIPGKTIVVEGKEKVSDNSLINL